MAKGWKLEGKRVVANLRSLPGVDRMVEDETKRVAYAAAQLAGSTGSEKYPRWFVGEWTSRQWVHVMDSPAPKGSADYRLRPGIWWRVENKGGRVGTVGTIIVTAPTGAARKRGHAALRKARLTLAKGAA